LDADPGSNVSLECFEDVGLTSVDGTQKATQVKAGTGANPISDSAEDLWKTFRNWIDQVKAKEIEPATTLFEIYVGSKAKGKLCQAMSDAQSPQEIASAIDSIKKTFEDKRAKKPRLSKTSKPTKATLNKLGLGLEKQLAIVLDPANEKSFSQIIKNFTYRSGSGHSFHDLMVKLQKCLVDDSIADVVLLYALGWTKKTLEEAIEQDKPPVISVDAFRKELVSYLKLFAAKLILPALAEIPTESQISADTVRPYVQQLKIIDARDEDLTEAIIDYLMTKANVTQYAKRNLINGSSLTEYDASLKRIWKNLHKNLELEGNSRDPIHFGQRLANKCLSEKEKLQGLAVPSNFTAGCFHSLADKLKIGWHQNYEAVLAKGKA
jgi:hypothetical protein